MKRNAFTLLELLVAITLAAIVAAGAFALMQSGMTAQRISASAVGGSVNTALAADMMAVSLKNALKPTGTLAGEFEGEEDSVSFYTTAQPDGDIGGDVVKVMYCLESQGQGDVYKLVRTVWRNLLSPKTLAGDSSVIIRNVKSLTMEYFDGDSWHDNWESSDQGDVLPVAANLEISIFDDDAELTESRHVSLLPGGSSDD